MARLLGSTVKAMGAAPARGMCIIGPRYTSIVRALPSVVPFIAPEEQERMRGRPFAARLGANENTFGPSPEAISAMRDAAADAWMYGDPKSHDLRAAIAARHGVGAANVLVGEGIDGLLSYAAGLLVEPGDPVVTTRGTYPTLNYFVAGRGGVVHTVPYGADDRHDLDALLAKAVEVNAKFIYLVNPDNPSGTNLSAAEVEAFVENLPPGVLLLLDEAYLELAPSGTAPRVAADDLRVLRLRTFSKGYGLAGARIGYAIGALEMISAFDKIRIHFGVSRISQAGALAALEDDAYLEQVVGRIAASRAELVDIAKTNGLKTIPSATNFVSVDCGRDAPFARAVLSALTEKNLFVRMPGAAPLDRCIRVSCAGEQEMDLFRRALPAALGAANKPLGH